MSGLLGVRGEQFVGPGPQIAEAVKHQTRGEIRLIAQAASLSRTPARIARPIALRGEDNQAVLGELGLSPQAIEALKSDAVL
ncbi:MAG: hypothetical protein EBX56_12025 [Betaproteobacteria bacterium]|nr:hypothetical protein [Betaproteobacteria bacterium]